MQRYFFLFALVVWLCGVSEATSPQVCGYTALNGSTVFLRYYPGIKEGDEFIDYGSGEDGICRQRAVCLETFETKIESCNNYKVDCINRNTVKSAFPACCVKC
uniref:Single domain-containing protein n=1 Tax=Ceratitis capitata TaxID=7213 RepID=W8BTP1_CERCA